MIGFERWLRSLILTLSVAALTSGCQLVFGDFKVGDQTGSAASGGQGQGQGGKGNGGGANASGGGAGVGQPSGPIVVFPTTDLYTSDGGAQAKFYVSLASQPPRRIDGRASEVTIPVTVPPTNGDMAEGKVAPESLIFTTDNWNAPQVVTVTGQLDPRGEGNEPYEVSLGPTASEADGFDGFSRLVPITNIDNDSAGFFVSPTSGLVTTEAGGQAFFTVVLNSAPEEGSAIIDLSSDDNRGTLMPTRLTFTPDNWSSPQRVTITGLDDKVADGDHAYQVTVSPSQSSAPAYAKLPSQTVNVTNQDNDHAGVMVVLSPTGVDPDDTTRLRTSESGDSATFTVVLNIQPEKNVKVDVTCKGADGVSSTTEGTVSPPSLIFTPDNWNAPQTVTVMGQNNDSVEDGNQPYQVRLDTRTSSDERYASLMTTDLPYVNVVNVDDDKANYKVTLLSGLDPNDASQLVTSESGAAATFSIVLTSSPTKPVTFILSSSNGNEGKLSAGKLDFTVTNWNVPQVVTVTGVNESEPMKDGNVVYSVRISSPSSEDPNYQNLQLTDVKVVNLDDDIASITPPKLLSGIDSGTKLITTELGGTATFSVSLTSKPTVSVSLPVMSSNPKEGTVSPGTLNFTAVNYSTPQIVTVTGVPDDVVDGNQVYTVTVGPQTSGDMNYAGLSQSVKVTNQDKDSAYIVPTPGYMGTTTEQGGSAVFGISLHSKPTDNVTLTFASSNVKEGKVSPTSLLFTSSNWATPQNITVTGVNDDVDDGDQMYNVSVTGASAGDQNYKYAATTLTLVNTNDDQAGMKVTAAANLQTTEAGGKATFTVVLNSQPTGNVNVTVSSSNTKEGTAAPASLAFTASNWSSAQTVTVTGVDDSVADKNQTYTVTVKTASSSADPKYAQLAASTVSFVNKDDDIVGIAVAPTTCATTPATTATFTVVLTSQPLGPVSITLSSDTPTEGKVAPATLSFTTSSWNAAQTVTVTGVDDGTVATMTAYKIVTAAAVSTTDANYNGFNAADVACVNTTPDAPPMPPASP